MVGGGWVGGGWVGGGELVGFTRSAAKIILWEGERGRGGGLNTA